MITRWPEHLQPPEFPPDVAAWFDERAITRNEQVIPALLAAGDPPPRVEAWAIAYQRWEHDLEAWRATMPVDLDDAANRVRFFGGPWLPGPYGFHEAYSFRIEEEDGEATRYTTWAPPRQLEQLAKRGAPIEELRALAAHIYEWHRVKARADSELGKRLRRLIEAYPEKR